MNERRIRILAIAAKEIGYAEKPVNLTKYGEWFGLNGVAWCGIFCSWAYAKAGLMIKGGGYSKGFAGCATIVASKKDKITTDPNPADLVIFDWNADKKVDHVALFVQWIEPGKTFETIEGNTSVKNQSNGGQVMRRTRNVSNVSCFINLIE
jgi:hypothetical protein